MRKQPVLMVSEYFHPHWTGLAQSFLNFACYLVEQGHQVQVLTTRHSSSLPASESCFGLDIKRSDCLFYISRTNYSLKILLDFIKMCRSFEVIIINSPCSNIFFLSLIAKLFRKKLFVYHQGDLLLAKHCGSKAINFSVERLFDLFTISSLAMCDSAYTYTLDYSSHSRVMKHFPKKCKAFIPPLRLPSGKASEEIRSKLTRSPDRNPILGFAGRFVEEKGFDLLLRAIPLVKKKFPSAHFVFAGEVNVYYERFYEANKSLINHSASSLTFLGLLKGGDLELFYKSLDAFILCSRSDCFALTQVEAALFGVPLIVSDIPGARMLVREAGCGVLVKPECPESLANGIAAVLAERECYANLTQGTAEFLSRYGSLTID
ncbi:MAG: glycosyltransferase family 4 protein [Deltaproteobacteria bacterium]|nr:glycosyltransferase family 4 protein [Deltaproteobacteria bacterium]